MQTITDKVKSLNLTLPEIAMPVGNYLPRLRVGNMLYISGQLPILDGKVAITGHVFGMQDVRSGEDRRAKRALEEGRTERIGPGRRKNDALSGQVAQTAAELCALNIIAHIAAETGDDISKVEQVIRLGGFVQCFAKFHEHAKVINTASDLMVNVFGSEVGKHVRAATGASSLPMGAAVEIEATVLLKS